MESDVDQLKAKLDIDIENADTKGSRSLLPTQEQREAEMTNLIEKPIPDREFLFKESIIPKAELTLIAGFNGSSKSFFSLELAVSISTGKAILRDDKGTLYFQPEKAGKVLILSVEDDQHDYGRRLKSIIGGQISKSDPRLINLIKKNLYFNSFAGLNVSGQLVAKDPSGIIKPTEDYEKLKQTIIAEQFDMVVIDPFHYVLGAITENANEEQGQSTGLIIALAKASGAAIVCPAHTSEGNPLKVRGGTAITDRARSCFSIATLSKLYEKKTPVTVPKKTALGEYKNKTHDIVRVGMTKNSHGRLLSVYYLFLRGKGGVLTPITIDSQETQIDFSSMIPAAIDSTPNKIASQVQIYEYLIAQSADGGMSESTIKRRIKDLVISGLIEVVEGTEGKAIFYQNYTTNDGAPE
jgi:hypothetical protein